MSPVLVWFKDDAYHQLEPPNLEINWDPFNLTMNKDAKVIIENCRISFSFHLYRRKIYCYPQEIQLNLKQIEF